ncbi:ribosome maturation factor RimM [Lysobacteraceae bacterium NML93-0792]|nr:ribosome maturation factor RimM [Xanthomonadaceae bacterium NML93-0792]PBS16432.1 ribosome maturation factor RimM [Xanthomonadaceae bacterium NML93-0793]PBS19241.1 ribosome maturation factor RimM [Xanthomonadaceae bacterium NML93-0831]
MNDPTRQPPRRMIQVGKVHGAFGVRGEVKLESFTEPRNAIFRYQPWVLRDARGVERECEGAKGRETPKGVVATLPGIDDRDAAEAARGLDVFVPREALPPPKPGEYYWVDLEGLRVRNVEGADFGVVSHLFSTGANDVLVAHGDRERMIPFVLPDYIVSIDFDAGLVTVDWDPEF